MTQKERLEKLAELRNPMSSVLKSVTMLKGDKGDSIKGDKGDTPVKGVDYFTDSELESIIKYIQSNVKNGEKGRSPVFTGSDEPINPQKGDIWYKD